MRIRERQFLSLSQIHTTLMMIAALAVGLKINIYLPEIFLFRYNFLLKKSNLIVEIARTRSILLYIPYD